MTRLYRLPGKKDLTSDEKVFVDAWMDAAKSIEKITGMRLVSFDPGFFFSDKEKCLSLPTWFVLLVNKFLEEA